MKPMRMPASIAALALIMCGCQPQQQVPEFTRSELAPGGEGTVSIQPFPSYMLPVSNLPQEQKKDFHAGKALAHQPWVKAPTITTARDGLGPIYNARTCLFCHINGGRGQLPEDDQQMLQSAFVRLSIPGEDKVHGVIPEPIYGDQLQSQSVALSHQLRTVTAAENLQHQEAPPEGYVFIQWEKTEFKYPDGERLELRSPNIDIRNLGYGDLHPETLFSLRNSPPIHGVGLLEAIAQKDIDEFVDPDDADGNGISGRVNQVWDFESGKTVAGRFGLKANKASVRLQTAGAFAADVGISNPVFPVQPCTDKQSLCRQTPDGNEPATTESPAVEISESLLTSVVDFTRSLGVPERRDADDEHVKTGRSLFYQTGCQHCHRPHYITSADDSLAHLAGQTIWPYSDLLLHDMGPALADGRSDYLASGSEWRTPPLWGIGLSKAVNGSSNFLHDGRARSIEEAIVWHGGEAEQIKENFIRLSRNDRQALIRFVESI